MQCVSARQFATMVTRNCVKFSFTPFVTHTEATVSSDPTNSASLCHDVKIYYQKPVTMATKNASCFLHFKLQSGNCDCYTDIRKPFLLLSSLTPSSPCRHCLRPEINSNKWSGWTKMSAVALHLFLLVTLCHQMSDILDKGVA